jgi:cephalosporin-C deacetylase
MTLHRLSGAVCSDRHEWPRLDVDPAYGHELPDLLAVAAPRDEPEDLDEFWLDVIARARAVDPRPRVSAWRDVEGAAGHEIADLRFQSLGGFVIGGWLVRSRAAVDRVVVVGHGYDGRSAATIADLPENVLAVFPVARGLPDRSLIAGVGGDGIPHVLWGIERPETYSHVGAVADTAVAGSVGLMLAPGVERLLYAGLSFGGGIGAITVGFDTRFDAAILELPSFGFYSWRLSVPSTGSGEIVRRHLVDHPEVRSTLRYTDAATAARRIHVPTLVMPALADPAVPPPSQFAIATAIGGPTWIHVLPEGHMGRQGAAAWLAERAEAIQEFWRDPSAIVSPSSAGE